MRARRGGYSKVATPGATTAPPPQTLRPEETSLHLASQSLRTEEDLGLPFSQTLRTRQDFPLPPTQTLRRPGHLRLPPDSNFATTGRPTSPLDSNFATAGDLLLPPTPPLGRSREVLFASVAVAAVTTRRPPPPRIHGSTDTGKIDASEIDFLECPLGRWRQTRRDRDMRPRETSPASP